MLFTLRGTDIYPISVDDFSEINWGKQLAINHLPNRLSPKIPEFSSDPNYLSTEDERVSVCDNKPGEIVELKSSTPLLGIPTKGD
ncbi:hypothetical protein Tco_0474788 [Tanacetum coccineum]